jgi:EAL domain-containing protein (putative c-di-GMP-specific phosphodiesterase class I)
MCNALDKHVVAEGVETQEQFDFVHSVACGAVQGYLIGRPMMAADVDAYLNDNVQGALSNCTLDH